jgi:hypothetical protein
MKKTSYIFQISIIFMLILLVSFSCYAGDGTDSESTKKENNEEESTSSTDDSVSIVAMNEAEQADYFKTLSTDDQVKALDEITDDKKLRTIVTKLTTEQKFALLHKLTEPTESGTIDASQAAQADTILSSESITAEERKDFFSQENVNLRSFPQSFTTYAREDLNIPDFTMQEEFLKGETQLVYVQSEGALLNQKEPSIKVRIKVEDVISVKSVSVTPYGFLIVPKGESAPVSIVGNGDIEKHGNTLTFTDPEGMSIDISGISGKDTIEIKSFPENDESQNVLSVKFTDGRAFFLRNDHGNEPKSFTVLPDGKISFLIEEENYERRYVLDLESKSHMNMEVNQEGDFILKSLTKDAGAHVTVKNPDGSKPEKGLTEIQINGKGHYLIKKDRQLNKDFHRFYDCVAYFEVPVSEGSQTYTYKVDGTDKIVDMYTGDGPLTKEQFDAFSYIESANAFALYADYSGFGFTEEKDRIIRYRDQNRYVGYLSLNPKEGELDTSTLEESLETMLSVGATGMRMTQEEYEKAVNYAKKQIAEKKRMHLASFRADTDLDEKNPLVITVFDNQKKIGKEYTLQNTDLRLTASTDQGYTTIHQKASFTEKSKGTNQFLETAIFSSDRPKWRKDANGKYHEAIPVGESWKLFSEAVERKPQEKLSYTGAGDFKSKFHAEFLGDTHAGEIIGFQPMEMEDVSKDKDTGSAAGKGNQVNILLVTNEMEGKGKHLIRSLHVDVQGQEISMGEGSAPLVLDIQDINVGWFAATVGSIFGTEDSILERTQLTVKGDQKAYLTYNGQRIYAPSMQLDLNLEDAYLDVSAKGTAKDFSQAGISAKEGNIDLAVKSDFKTGQTTIKGKIRGDVSFDQSSVFAPKFPDEEKEYEMEASFSMDTKEEGIIHSSVAAFEKGNSEAQGKIYVDIDTSGEETEISISGYYRGRDDFAPTVSRLVVSEAGRGIHVKGEDLSLILKGQEGMDEFSAKGFSGTINTVVYKDDTGKESSVYEFEGLTVDNLRATVGKLGELQDVEAQIGELRGSGVVFGESSLAESILNLDNVRLGSKGKETYLSYKDSKGRTYRASLDELEARGVQGTFLNLDAAYLRGKDISFVVTDTDGTTLTDISAEELEAMGAQFDVTGQRIRVDTLKKGVQLKFMMHDPKTGKTLEASVPEIAAKDAEFKLEQQYVHMEDIQAPDDSPVTDIKVVMKEGEKESEISIDSITGDALTVQQKKDIIVFTENVNLIGGTFKEKTKTGWKDILIISEATGVTGTATLSAGDDTEAAFTHLTADRLVAALIQEGVKVDITYFDSGKRLWLTSEGTGSEGGLRAAKIEGRKGDISFASEDIEEMTGSFLFNGGILQMDSGSAEKTKILKDNLELIIGQITINDALGFHVSVDATEQYYGKLTQMRSDETAPEKIIVTIDEISQIGAREDARREVTFDATLKRLNIIEVGKDGKAEVVLSMNTDKINELLGGQEFAHIKGTVQFPSGDDTSSEFILKIQEFQGKITQGKAITAMDLKTLVPGDPDNAFVSEDDLTGEVSIFTKGNDGIYSEVMTLLPHMLDLKVDLRSLELTTQEFKAGYKVKSDGKVVAQGTATMEDVTYRMQNDGSFDSQLEVNTVTIDNNEKGPKVFVKIKDLKGDLKEKELDVLGTVDFTTTDTAEDATHASGESIKTRLYREVIDGKTHIYLEIPQGTVSQGETTRKGEVKIAKIAEIEGTQFDVTRAYEAYAKEDDSQKFKTLEQFVNYMFHEWKKGSVTIDDDGTTVKLTPKKGTHGGVADADVTLLGILGFKAPEWVTGEMMDKVRKAEGDLTDKERMDTLDAETLQLPRSIPSLTENLDATSIKEKKEAENKKRKQNRIKNRLRELNLPITQENYKKMAYIMYGV